MGANLDGGGKLTEEVPVKSLRIWPDPGFLLPPNAKPGTLGSLALERTQLVYFRPRPKGEMEILV